MFKPGSKVLVTNEFKVVNQHTNKFVEFEKLGTITKTQGNRLLVLFNEIGDYWFDESDIVKISDIKIVM